LDSGRASAGCDAARASSSKAIGVPSSLNGKGRFASFRRVADH
jgi:hypothetical protein